MCTKKNKKISHGNERKLLLKDLLHLVEVLEPFLLVLGLGGIIQQSVDLWVGVSMIRRSPRLEV
jgi:hypothetical protein